MSRNRTSLRFIIFIVTLITIVTLCGCDFMSGRYPFQKAEKWICESPQISLEYTQNSQGTWDFSEMVIWNDEMIEVSIGMRGNDYCVYPADSNHYDDRLLSGTWKYRNGNLVLVVEEDFIFGNQYSEIVLLPVTAE